MAGTLAALGSRCVLSQLNYYFSYKNMAEVLLAGMHRENK